MTVLSKIIDTTDTTDKDVAKKEAHALTRFRRPLPIFKQRSPLKHRLRILQACILQTILWGAETWHVTKKRMSHLRGIHLSETGRIRFWTVRFQTPNSVSFLALTEFQGENSVSSSQPLICVTKVTKQTHRVFAELTEFAPKLSEAQ